MALKLPARLCATYFTLWGGGSRITSVPTTYNQIYLFHAVPSGNGAFRFDYSNAVTKAEIKTCQDRGQRVVLTVGGANAGFNFQTRAQAQAFVNSFKVMYDQLGGVDGCDFNNFEARIGSSPTEMTWIAQQLKAAYGPDFSISAPPAPGAGWAPMDRTLTAAMAKAGVMDYAGPQFYDSSDLTQESTIVNLIDEWVANMGSAEKVVVGLSSNYGAGPTLATCQSAWKKIVAKHPKIRGVFAWSAQDDAGGGYNWGKTMGPLVGATLVTDTPTTPPVVPPPVVQPPVVSPPLPSGVVAYVPGARYAMGDKVLYRNGKTYEVYQVNGKPPSSEGTDPLISTWYWREVATTPPVVQPPVQPPVIEPLFKVGDKVALGNGTTGVITQVVGTSATVRLDTTVTADFSKLVKL